MLTNSRFYQRIHPYTRLHIKGSIKFVNYFVPLDDFY